MDERAPSRVWVNCGLSQTTNRRRTTPVLEPARKTPLLQRREQAPRTTRNGPRNERSYISRPLFNLLHWHWMKSSSGSRPKGLTNQQKSVQPDANTIQSLDAHAPSFRFPPAQASDPNTDYRPTQGQKCRHRHNADPHEQAAWRTRAYFRASGEGAPSSRPLPLLFGTLR